MLNALLWNWYRIQEGKSTYSRYCYFYLLLNLEKALSTLKSKVSPLPWNLSIAQQSLSSQHPLFWTKISQFVSLLFKFQDHLVVSACLAAWELKLLLSFHSMHCITLHCLASKILPREFLQLFKGTKEMKAGQRFEKGSSLKEKEALSWPLYFTFHAFCFHAQQCD